MTKTETKSVTPPSGGSAILDYLTTRCWALDHPVLVQLAGVVQRKLQGSRATEQEVQDIVRARDVHGRVIPDRMIVDSAGIATIPIYGVIAPHASQVNGSSQPRGTSIDEIQRNLASALRDEDVRGIMLEIGSPGGSAEGVVELADDIYTARDIKPIYATTSSLAASAAYFLGSQAEKFFATRGGEVGSIGVYNVLVDDTALIHNEGYKIEVIKAGAHKGTGMTGTPFSEEQKAEIQRGVDSIYDLFVEAVARGRNLSEEEARALADGRMHIASEALSLGLIDEVLTMAEARSRLIAAIPSNDNPSNSVMAVPRGTVGKVAAMPEGTTEMGLTAEVVASDFPSIAEQFRGEGATSASDAERQRAANIVSAAAPEQHELACTLIAEGKPESEALMALIQDRNANEAEWRKTAEAKGKLDALAAAAPESPGADAKSYNDGVKPEGGGSEASLEQRWAALPSDEREFLYLGDIEQFKAMEEKRSKQEGGE